MDLEVLRVSHLPKNQEFNSAHSVPSALSTMMNWPGVFFLDTCQRWVWVSSSKKNPLFPVASPGMEIYEGRDAYLFLLRLASGLESKVLGETDIFGQMKEAWRKFENLHYSSATDLSPWMQRVFEDTKDIRTRYLQNLGGSSYGSLVRKVVRDYTQGSNQSVFLVGAGKIAKSIAPYLLDSELWVWNRDSIRLCAFYEDIAVRSQAGVRKIKTGEEEIKAWREAKNLVVCIPLDPVQDSQRIQWFKSAQDSNRAIIHLGGMRGQCGEWESLPNFYCLSDLFGLQSTLGNVRSVQIMQAERACEERAKLRALGTSLSIPHGWEDLAVFA